MVDFFCSSGELTETNVHAEIKWYRYKVICTYLLNISNKTGTSTLYNLHTMLLVLFCTNKTGIGSLLFVLYNSNETGSSTILFVLDSTNKTITSTTFCICT